ncbi:hypothetical protein Leryth_026365, partial [Lithospermum erythrorhizon]
MTQSPIHDGVIQSRIEVESRKVIKRNKALHQGSDGLRSALQRLRTIHGEYRTDFMCALSITTEEQGTNIINRYVVEEFLVNEATKHYDLRFS